MKTKDAYKQIADKTGKEDVVVDTTGALTDLSMLIIEGAEKPKMFSRVKLIKGIVKVMVQLELLVRKYGIGGKTISAYEQMELYLRLKQLKKQK